MLTIYRRHLKKCDHSAEGRKYRRCHCPIWVDGYISGKRVRETLDTRDWQKALEDAREREITEKPPQPVEEPTTVKAACDVFTEDAKARGLRQPTLYKYDLLFRELRDFSVKQGVRYIREFDVPLAGKFRAEWKNRNIAARKKLERFRAFFAFCQDHGWIDGNPAKKLKYPKTQDRPTLPFTQGEMKKILAACGRYLDEHPKAGQYNSHRILALVLFLRYSGLSIRDAVTLPCDRLTNGRLFLYRAKTGTPVYVPLPDFVVDTLQDVRKTNPQYFFWTGQGKPKSAVGDWQRSLKRLFKLAEIPDGHAHRFRDTFAVELLLAGVPMERVSMLLGHRSVKVTEKHYAPWVRARQEQLEADVQRVWNTDPILSSPTYGTYRVHEKNSNAESLITQ